MHSRIFQISKEPIYEEDYIKESRYYDHWFLGSVADYVNEDTDRAADIQWLQHCYDGKGLIFGTDEGGEYFIIEDKIKYFTLNFESFQIALEELSNITIEGFASQKSYSNIYALKSAYEDKCGFYVDGDEFGMYSLDGFIRWSDNGTKFYIGATIDYHF